MDGSPDSEKGPYCPLDNSTQARPFSRCRELPFVILEGTAAKIARSTEISSSPSAGKSSTVSDKREG